MLINSTSDSLLSITRIYPSACWSPASGSLTGTTNSARPNTELTISFLNLLLQGSISHCLAFPPSCPGHKPWNHFWGALSLTLQVCSVIRRAGLLSPPLERNGSWLHPPPAMSWPWPEARTRSPSQCCLRKLCRGFSALHSCSLFPTVQPGLCPDANMLPMASLQPSVVYVLSSSETPCPSHSPLAFAHMSAWKAPFSSPAPVDLSLLLRSLLHYVLKTQIEHPLICFHSYQNGHPTALLWSIQCPASYPNRGSTGQKLDASSC